MTRLLVNDVLTTIPNTRTFWHELQDWFGLFHMGGDYSTLADYVDGHMGPVDPCLIIRNASYFGPLRASEHIPTISLLQDIMADGPGRATQIAVSKTSAAMVFNSRYTAAQYGAASEAPIIIPLPVDFDLFQPGNAMGLQQSLGLPDGCICWVGASQGAAAQIKGYDIFLQIARLNADLRFVAVFKDAIPEYCPPNVRMYAQVPQDELCRIMGACRVGLCTSRQETQHLAGIEMGACGLPLVVPPVGTYWKRDDMPGEIINTAEAGANFRYMAALRMVLESPDHDAEVVRRHWQKDFDRPVIRAQWTELVEEVES